MGYENGSTLNEHQITIKTAPNNKNKKIKSSSNNKNKTNTTPLTDRNRFLPLDSPPLFRHKNFFEKLNNKEIWITYGCS